MVIPLAGHADEQEIIDSIYHIEPFRLFYKNRWLPRKDDIKVSWIISPGLWLEGYYAMAGVNQSTGDHMIFLTQGPKKYADAHLVAHEMDHVIRRVDNMELSITDQKPEYRNIVGFISSILEDRSIDKSLMENYKFNISNLYGDMVNYALQVNSSLIGLNIMPNTIEYVENVLKYANNILKFTHIKGDTKQKLDKYRHLMNDHCLQIAKDGEDIVTQSASFDLETLAGKKQLFYYIVNKYNIANAVFIE